MARPTQSCSSPPLGISSSLAHPLAYIAQLRQGGIEWLVLNRLWVVRVFRTGFVIGDVYSWPEIDRWQNRGRADEGRIQAWDESEGWWNGQARIGDRRGHSGLDQIGGRPPWIGSETGGAGK